MNSSWRHNALLRVKHSASWHLLRNPGSKKRFLEHGRTLNPAQAELVQALKLDGIATTEVVRAGIDPAIWQALKREVEAFSAAAVGLIKAAEEGPLEALHFGALQHNQERFGRFFQDQSAARNDDYIIKMNAEQARLDPCHPLLLLGTSPAILHVVNSYLGLWSKLVYADAWYSIPVDPGRRIGSQHWHRDPDDRRMVKVYLYLVAVNEGAGPMEYIVGTTNAADPHARDIARWRAAGAALYPPESEISARFSASEKRVCLGESGTLIFCDTTGLHRGGLGRSGPRILATWTFVTPASLGKRRFDLGTRGAENLTDEAQFALS